MPACLCNAIVTLRRSGSCELSNTLRMHFYCVSGLCVQTVLELIFRMNRTHECMQVPLWSYSTLALCGGMGYRVVLPLPIDSSHAERPKRSQFTYLSIAGIKNRKTSPQSIAPPSLSRVFCGDVFRLPPPPPSRSVTMLNATSAPNIPQFNARAASEQIGEMMLNPSACAAIFCQP
jgi:hypothetical protein